MELKYNVATFAGGCFWCTEAIFKRLKGVKSVIPGYSGGDMENPTYDDVSTGQTGHAEAVQITFDPNITPYEELVDVFFKTHDPTDTNGQGPDIGPQYRSIIFYHDQKQKKIAQEMKLPDLTIGVSLRSELRVEDFSLLLRRERNPSKAEISSQSSTGSCPRFSAKGDKR